MEIEHRLTAVEERSKSNTHRINDLEQKQNDLSDLVGAVSALSEREKKVEDDVKEIKSDVKILTIKPAKRWEDAVKVAISTVIGGVIGYVLFKLGLGG